MPELPKPKRVDIWNARKYIKDVCDCDYNDINPALFDALCNDEVYFIGDLHTPRSGGDTLIEWNHRVAPLFWRHWGFNAFDHGTLAGSAVCLPNQSEYNKLFYTNLTIETALLDTWLNTSQNPKVKVSSVSEKVYRKRVEQANSMGISYSRGEDREWAKANGYSVGSVDLARNSFAPKEWTDKGRRSAEKTARESAKETAN